MSHIWRAVPQMRTDRKKVMDTVECIVVILIPIASVNLFHIQTNDSRLACDFA